jgi:L-lysine 2,3-aminomutase
MKATVSVEAAQCHSYCVANLDYYVSQRKVPADKVSKEVVPTDSVTENATEEIVVSIEPASNGTNESELFESATNLCVMANALCALLCRYCSRSW